MENTLRLEITEEEARAKDVEMERMIEVMRQANEHIRRQQQEVARLQAETRDIIARIKEWQRVGTTI